MSNRKRYHSSDDAVELKGACHPSHPNKSHRPVHVQWDSIDFDLESMESYFQSTSDIFVANAFPTSGRLDSILEEADPEPDPEGYPHLLELPPHNVEDDSDCIDAWTNNPPSNEHKQWGLKIWADPECFIDGIAYDMELKDSAIAFVDSSSFTPSVVNSVQTQSSPLQGDPINMSGVPTEKECASMIDCALPSIVQDPAGVQTQVSSSGSRRSSKKHRRASCVML